MGGESLYRENADSASDGESYVLGSRSCNKCVDVESGLEEGGDGVDSACEGENALEANDVWELP